MICPVNLRFICKRSLDGLQNDVLVTAKNFCLCSRLKEKESQFYEGRNFISIRGNNFISFITNRVHTRHYYFTEYFANITHICQYCADINATQSHLMSHVTPLMKPTYA